MAFGSISQKILGTWNNANLPLSYLTVSVSRIKRIDFTGIALSTDLPKNLALTSAAIRMVHFNNDPLAYSSHNSDYVSLVRTNIVSFIL